MDFNKGLFTAQDDRPFNGSLLMLGAETGGSESSGNQEPAASNDYLDSQVAVFFSHCFWFLG